MLCTKDWSALKQLFLTVLSWSPIPSGQFLPIPPLSTFWNVGKAILAELQGDKAFTRGEGFYHSPDYFNAIGSKQ
jgi:hypothetical protein